MQTYHHELAADVAGGHLGGGGHVDSAGWDWGGREVSREDVWWADLWDTVFAYHMNLQGLLSAWTDDIIDAVTAPGHTWD